jgi:tetratricopeptide (TPR) repeat protein
MPNAPKVFISYSHDSLEHRDRVWALSNRLRRGGIDCQIDQYEESPEKGWPQWCDDQIEEAEPLYQRALAIWEKALGPDHPDVATALENYAVLLRKMGGVAKAGRMESRAAAIRAKPRSGSSPG